MTNSCTKSGQIWTNLEEYERVGSVKHPQIKEKGVGSVKTKFKKKDGTMLDVFLSSAAKKDRDISNGIVFTALDISQLKETQKALERSQNLRSGYKDHPKARCQGFFTKTF